MSNSLAVRRQSVKDTVDAVRVSAPWLFTIMSGPGLTEDECPVREETTRDREPDTGTSAHTCHQRHPTLQVVHDQNACTTGQSRANQADLARPEDDFFAAW